MKLIDLYDLAVSGDAKLSAGDLGEMEREKERTSPEKERLIAEIVAALFAEAKG